MWVHLPCTKSYRQRPPGRVPDAAQLQHEKVAGRRNTSHGLPRVLASSREMV